MGALATVHSLIGDGRGFWKPGKQISYAITFTCELSFILFGIEQGLMGNLIDGDNFLDTFGRPTGSYLGIIVSIYTLGCFFGCVLNYFTGDILGRRLTLMLAMVIVFVGVILQSSSFSVPQLMIGRFLGGLGTGMETSTVPMYQSENCESHVRGRLVTSENMFVGVGLIYAYWLTYGMSFTSGSLKWRFPMATQIIFAGAVFLLCLTICESPRYLYKIGKKEEAKKTLAYVFGREEDDPKIQSMYNEIEESMLLEAMEEDKGWASLFKKDAIKTGQRLIIAYIGQVGNQLSGINVLNYYITTVLIQNVGLDSNLAMILGGCSVTVFAIASIVPAVWCDRIGRRIPGLLGHAGCGFSMMMVAILLSFQDNPALSKKTGSAAVTFFFTYQVAFGSSINSIPWVLVPEILPLQIRAKGTAFSIAGNWMWNFFVVEITPTLITNIKFKSYIIFAVTNAFFVVFYYFCVPEVRNVSLEAVDTLFLNEGRICMGLVNTDKYRKLPGDVEHHLIQDGSKASAEHLEKQELTTEVDSSDVIQE